MTTASVMQALQTDQAEVEVSVATYDADHRALSATAVASGSHPLRRMHGPGVPRRVSVDPSGASAVLLWVGRGGLTCSTPEQTEPHAATMQIIADALHTPGRVAVPVDRGAVRAMTNLLRKAPDEFKTPLRQVDLASKVPASSRLVVLTEALARTFWLPSTAASTIASWASVCGLPADHHGFRELLSRVFDPAGILARQEALDAKIAKFEDAAFEAAKNYGPVAAADAFQAVTLLTDLWLTHERIDPLLRARFLFTGEVVEVTPFEMRGTLIACHASQPFRLRPGTMLLTDPRDPDHEQRGIRLGSLGFDDGSLTAVFEAGALSGSRGNNSRGSKGYAKLLGAYAAHETMLVTPEPFMSSTGKPVSRFRWASQSGTATLEPIRRDVPLDVLLAGAPVSDG